MIKYETKMRVEYYETDAMGIVHHSNYIRYFETARTELFRSMGYSYDEIAQILDVNVGTIKSRISRGREKLREKLSAIGGTF